MSESTIWGPAPDPLATPENPAPAITPEDPAVTAALLCISREDYDGAIAVLTGSQAAGAHNVSSDASFKKEQAMASAQDKANDPLAAAKKQFSNALQALFYERFGTEAAIMAAREKAAMITEDINDPDIVSELTQSVNRRLDAGSSPQKTLFKVDPNLVQDVPVGQILSAANALPTNYRATTQKMFDIPFAPLLPEKT